LTRCLHPTMQTAAIDNAPAPSAKSPVSIEEVLDDELEQIRFSRPQRLEAGEATREAKNSLIGLAFSGGGIRSATFNLGVLQGLAQIRMLRKFDYISTVSGGGYIGGWLMGWMQHQKIGIREVEEKLAPKSYVPRNLAEPSEVRFLRSYSNYLTPRKGILSADFWAFVASYLRNTLLNVSILLLVLLGILLLPRAIAYLPHYLIRFDDWGYGLSWLTGKTPTDVGFAQYWALVVAIAAGLISVVAMGLNFCWIRPQNKPEECWIAKPWAIHLFILVPLLISAALFSYGLDQIFRFDLPADELGLGITLIGLCVYTSLWVAACLARSVARRLVWRDCDPGPKNRVILIPAMISGALGGLLMLPYGMSVNGQPSGFDMMSTWKILTFGTPGLVLIMLLIGALHIGLMGRQFEDAYREWWARLGGWLALYAGGWATLFLMVAYVPIWLRGLLAYENVHGHRFTVSGVFVWVVSTAYGVLFGKNSKTKVQEPAAPTKKKIPEWLARVTPYIFILGMMIGLSVLSGKIAAFICGQPFDLSSSSENVSHIMLFVWLVFIGAAVLLSSRVDINAFSLHLLYRNRLMRCYLGASVSDRKEQPFTGFSVEDDLPLSLLAIPLRGGDRWQEARPIALLNASLNVTRGKELALQSRKARSFAITPKYAGYTRPSTSGVKWKSAFAPSELAGRDKPGTENGVTLGTAMAISGAAASPNMGSYSSPALAFLMTVFDVRLGWWVGNPHEKKWTKGSPDIGFWCLLKELFGAANDESDYVYLSDGGHFENLGIYELVRRRCKLIVAGDASCDPKYTFADLHNAMERCRSDFGVEIERTTHQLVPQAGFVTEHFDVCKIQYTPGRKEDDGILLYLKPALKRDDPEDMLGYTAVNHAFPHDSTADQWFDEGRFETYRNLGYVSALAVEAELGSRIKCLLGSEASSLSQSL